jgi:ethanolamine transporter EutH
MRYFKSVLAGVVALFLAAFVFIVIQVFRAIQIAKREHPGAAEVGIDIVALFKSPLPWVVVLLAFGIGFWWRFRSAS